MASAIIIPSGPPQYIATSRTLFPQFKSSSHAEMITLDLFEDALGAAKNLHLITTMEPCLMCAARIAMSNVTRVTYLTEDPTAGAITGKAVFPPDFRERLATIHFDKFAGDPSIIAIGQRLYEACDEIWRKSLKLSKP